MRLAAITLALIGLTPILGAMAYIRLAPDDPARWHLATKSHNLALEEIPSEQRLCLRPSASGDNRSPVRAGCWIKGSPDDVLTRLDAIALAFPRTSRLAGTAATGRITWVSRSAFWGFPDYITAEADAVGDFTRLDISSRQRYGTNDHGVNAARLKQWLSQL